MPKIQKEFRVSLLLLKRNLRTPKKGILSEKWQGIASSKFHKPRGRNETRNNRLQSDTVKLEKLWESTAKATSELQSAPGSIEALRKATGQVRSIFCMFSEYQLVWIS